MNTTHLLCFSIHQVTAPVGLGPGVPIQREEGQGVPYSDVQCILCNGIHQMSAPMGWGWGWGIPVQRGSGPGGSLYSEVKVDCSSLNMSGGDSCTVRSNDSWFIVMCFPHGQTDMTETLPSGNFVAGRQKIIFNFVTRQKNKTRQTLHFENCQINKKTTQKETDPFAI